MKRTGVLLLWLLMMPAAWAVPPIQEARLDNGLRVLLIEAHQVPMVAMQLNVVAGSRFDAKGREGSAMMLATMLTDHTAKHAHEAWNRLLDQDAIKLGSGIDADRLSLSLTVLREALAPGLDALAEALLQPGWHRKRFTSLQQDAVAAAHKAKEEPGVVASEASRALLFGAHPYGHRAQGTPESLRHVTLPDLQQLYRRQVKPAGAVLAVSGDITMQELLAYLKPRLATWQGRPEQALYAIAKPAVVQGQRKDVAMNTTQALVQLVRLGPARNAEDFFPVFVLNHMLGGGGFGSQLMTEVREKRGLVYGVYSYFAPLATRGPFVITLQTRADQADEASRVVRQTMRAMAEGHISSKDLKAAQANLVGGFAQRLDSNRERVGLMSMIGLYGLPLDYLQVWTQRVESVTLDDVRKAAATYLNPATWNQIRVGPPEGEDQPA